MPGPRHGADARYQGVLVGFAAILINRLIMWVGCGYSLRNRLTTNNEVS